MSFAINIDTQANRSTFDCPICLRDIDLIVQNVAQQSFPLLDQCRLARQEEHSSQIRLYGHSNAGSNSSHEICERCLEARISMYVQDQSLFNCHICRLQFSNTHPLQEILVDRATKMEIGDQTALSFTKIQQLRRTHRFEQLTELRTPRREETVYEQIVVDITRLLFLSSVCSLQMGMFGTIAGISDAGFDIARKAVTFAINGKTTQNLMTEQTVSPFHMALGCLVLAAIESSLSFGIARSLSVDSSLYATPIGGFKQIFKYDIGTAYLRPHCGPESNGFIELITLLSLAFPLPMIGGVMIGEEVVKESTLELGIDSMKALILMTALFAIGTAIGRSTKHHPSFSYSLVSGFDPDSHIAPFSV